MEGERTLVTSLSYGQVGASRSPFEKAFARGARPFTAD